MTRSATIPFVALLTTVAAIASAQEGPPSIPQRLAAGDAVLGFFGAQREDNGGELAAGVRGADFVFYSLESGPFDIPGVERFRDRMGDAAAAAGTRPHPMALRIPPIGDDVAGANDRVRQALAAEMSIIIVPHVRTAAEASAALATTADRAWPNNPEGTLVNWLIVEDREGVSNAEAIAATEGVSGIIAGPGDLSRAYDRDTEAVENAIQTILGACKQADVPCGITAGEADIEMRLQQGFRIFIVTGNAALPVANRWRRQRAEDARVEAMMAAERPIAAVDTVWMEDLTWMEIRDLQRAGTRTAIIATGGLEENGPYLTTGKHNVILEAACEQIARQLGDALCAPILKFVPEGSFDPPSGHMRFPGSISLSEQTYEAVVHDIASSLHATGFEHVVMIGDSGGNQRGLRNVAERLNAGWGQQRAHFIPEFYEIEALLNYVADDLGVEEPIAEGLHDNFAVTAMVMAVDPAGARHQQRVAAGRASINGADITPAEAVAAIGRKVIAFRVAPTVEAIRAAIEASDS